MRSSSRDGALKRVLNHYGWAAYNFITMRT